MGLALDSCMCLEGGGAGKRDGFRVHCAPERWFQILKENSEAFSLLCQSSTESNK